MDQCEGQTNGQRPESIRCLLRGDPEDDPDEHRGEYGFRDYHRKQRVAVRGEFAIAVAREARFGRREPVLARGDDEKNSTGDGRSDDLDDPVGQDCRPFDAPCHRAAECDRRVEMAARDMSEGVRARDNREAECERDADEADAHVDRPVLNHFRREDCGTTATEDEPERSDKFRPQAVRHGSGHGIDPFTCINTKRGRTSQTLACDLPHF